MHPIGSPTSAPAPAGEPARPAERLSGRRASLELAALLLLYFALAIPLAVVQRERMNPDGVCYIQLARYLAAGNVVESISGYWSPLFSWCIALFLRAGVDAVYTTGIIMVLSGALCVWSVRGFVNAAVPLGESLRRTTMALAAGCISILAGLAVATPDLLLAACLFMYFTAISREKLLHSRLGAFCCGMLGGVAYLAKAYALPFVLLHYPLALAWFWARGRWSPGASRVAARECGRTWLWGMLGLALVAGPWVGVLSWRYGGPTISTVGPRAHAIAGPADVPRFHPMAFAIPKDGTITVWERPEDLPYRYWSPLQSAAYMKHQFYIVVKNSAKLAMALWTTDLLGLSLLAAILLPAAIWRLRRREVFWPLAWLGMTAVALCAGFIPLHFEGRYVAAILAVFAIAACFLMIGSIASAKARAVLVGIVIGSFAIAALRLWAIGLRTPFPAAYRQIARELVTIDGGGRLASSNWTAGLYVAFHAGRPFVGLPEGTDPEAGNQLLRSHEVPTLLVWKTGDWRESRTHDGERARAIVKAGAWHLKADIKTGEPGPVEVYVRPTP